MKSPGYAGRKYVGRRRAIDSHTPGMPAKHTVWPGMLVPTGYHAENGAIKKDVQK